MFCLCLVGMQISCGHIRRGCLWSGSYPGQSIMHGGLHILHLYLSYMPLDMSLALAYSPKKNQSFLSSVLFYFILLPNLQKSRLSRSCKAVGSCYFFIGLSMEKAGNGLWRSSMPYTLAKSGPRDRYFSIVVYL